VKEPVLHHETSTSQDIQGGRAPAPPWVKCPPRAGFGGRFQKTWSPANVGRGRVVKQTGGLVPLSRPRASEFRPEPTWAGPTTGGWAGPVGNCRTRSPWQRPGRRWSPPPTAVDLVNQTWTVRGRPPESSRNRPVSDFFRCFVMFWGPAPPPGIPVAPSHGTVSKQGAPWVGPPDAETRRRP